MIAIDIHKSPKSGELFLLNEIKSLPLLCTIVFVYFSATISATLQKVENNYYLQNAKCTM